MNAPKPKRSFSNGNAPVDGAPTGQYSIWDCILGDPLYRGVSWG